MGHKPKYTEHCLKLCRVLLPSLLDCDRKISESSRGGAGLESFKAIAIFQPKGKYLNMLILMDIDWSVDTNIREMNRKEVCMCMCVGEGIWECVKKVRGIKAKNQELTV